MAKISMVVLAVLVSLGLAVQGVEALSQVFLRERVARSYELVASLRPGMARGLVEARLRAASGRLFTDRDNSNTLHPVVPYTLMEACGVALTFREGRLEGLHVGDWNQPGPCVGAPVSWAQSTERR
jgi:hypothetical protein